MIKVKTTLNKKDPEKGTVYRILHTYRAYLWKICTAQNWEVIYHLLVICGGLFPEKLERMPQGN